MIIENGKGTETVCVPTDIVMGTREVNAIFGVFDARKTLGT